MGIALLGDGGDFDGFSCGTEYTHIYLSIGGNDVLGSCGIAKSVVQSNIEQVISLVQAKAPNDAKIVLSGYAVPSSEFDCSDFSLVQSLLNAAVAGAAAAKGVTYVEATKVGGSDGTSRSNPCYFADAIHLNARGYQKLWCMSGMQSAFGCTGTTSGVCTDDGQCGGSGGGATTGIPDGGVQAEVTVAVIVLA